MATAIDCENKQTQRSILKRLLFLGPTGAGKSKMINCCYNRSGEAAMLEKPAAVSVTDRIIGTTSSISNYVDQRNKIVYVDTVGYGDVRFHESKEAFLLFFREFICYSSIGFNWIFLFLRYSQMSQDTLTYIHSLEGLLGEKAFSRCTIVFTHCKQTNMTLKRCVDANIEHTDLVNILKKVNNVIFGDMDTDETATEANTSDDDAEFAERMRQVQANKRIKFMQQILGQIDQIDEETLTLQTDRYQYYMTKFSTLIAYLWEKIAGKPSELSKLYKLAVTLKKGIPLTIYYEECSICRELIIEIVDHSPKACITKCGHIYHYDCLKKVFDVKKKCPNCQKDLRNLPQKMSGLFIGLQEIRDSRKCSIL